MWFRKGKMMASEARKDEGKKKNALKSNVYPAQILSYVGPDLSSTSKVGKGGIWPGDRTDPARGEGSPHYTPSGAVRQKCRGARKQRQWLQLRESLLLAKAAPGCRCSGPSNSTLFKANFRG